MNNLDMVQEAKLAYGFEHGQKSLPLSFATCNGNIEARLFYPDDISACYVLRFYHSRDDRSFETMANALDYACAVVRNHF